MGRSATEIIRENIPLAERTTIGLGGNARYFAQCETAAELRAVLEHASRNRLKFVLLGGGSNVIFPDDGFDGLVIGVAIKGYHFEKLRHGVILDAAAGEEWDRLVVSAVNSNFAGIECLSGIPGFVGATPIQNVGAYGQEVAETIQSVEAIDLRTMRDVQFTKKECRFSYRQSRFKGDDKDTFVITRVKFLLRTDGRPTIAYPELLKQIETRHHGNADLARVRQTVLGLRRGKSMLIDASDPNSRSVGSFFMNPVVTEGFFRALQEKLRGAGATSSIPSFPAEGGVKIPAAWLVEHAGFHKGHRAGGVGISANHALALVNHGGTTRELLGLAEKIRSEVQQRFSIQLQIEPSIVP